MSHERFGSYFLFKEFSPGCHLRSPIPRRRGHSCGKVLDFVNTADSKSHHSGYCWVKLHNIMDTVEFYSMTSWTLLKSSPWHHGHCWVRLHDIMNTVEFIVIYEPEFHERWYFQNYFHLVLSTMNKSVLLLLQFTRLLNYSQWDQKIVVRSSCREMFRNTKNFS